MDYTHGLPTQRGKGLKFQNERAQSLIGTFTVSLTSQEEDDLRDLEEDSHVAPSHLERRPSRRLPRPCYGLDAAVSAKKVSQDGASLFGIFCISTKDSHSRV